MHAIPEQLSNDSSPDHHPEDFTELHEYLQHVRTSQHMSMTDVIRRHVQLATCESEHLTLPQLSKLESGRVRNPRFKTMVFVARAYGVTLNDLARYVGSLESV